MGSKATRYQLLATIAMLGVGVVACGGSETSADAGDDFTVALGEPPVFDGCGSSGDGLIYTWTIVEAPTDMADDVGKVLRQSISDCRFTLESEMEVADAGRWVIELRVEGDGAMATDRVAVTVS